MPQAEQPCSRGNSDIFVRIPSTLSTLSGRGSPVSKNGTVTNGENVFPITQIVAAWRENGLPIIFSGAGGGSGSFRCKAATSALASFTTAASLNSQRDRLWDNDCTGTFLRIPSVAKSS